MEIEKKNMYHLGKIYKVVNMANSEIYIGSTVKKLSNRMAGHRSSHRAKLEDGINYKNNGALYNAMREYGAENFKIILIEDYKCENKEQLRAREDHYINLFQPKLNNNNAVYNREKQRETDKKYREEHKEHIAELNKEYQRENKEKVNEKSKRYYDNHREEFKAKRSTKVYCDTCKCEINKSSKLRHEKTAKHMSLSI